MLVAHSMGSHGGQQDFPFGYNPNELHGIGLPDFMTPGPPPGQPLLSENDTQNLSSFLDGFDAAGDQHKVNSVQHFQGNVSTGQGWIMPPTFVGSETSLRTRNSGEWQQNYQASEFGYGHDMNMSHMNHPTDFHNVQGNEYNATGQYDHNLLNQLHNAAQTMQPSFPHGWQQQQQHHHHPNFPPQSVPHVQQQSGSVVRFGSDPLFRPNGYVPPEGQFDPQPSSLEWLEAHSSAANTQPNTEPNTQPSSPNWSKKRKLDDYQMDSLSNGFNPATNGYSGRTRPTPPDSTHQHKRTLTNQEQPPTPTSRTRPNFQQENDNAIEDDDADYDEEDGAESRTRSASPSSSSKAMTGKSSKSRARKKSTASASMSRLKSSKSARNSIAGAATARTPLTADQKKANHTNSEQRRRDATARAYAELYDLVPELEEMGKQSTMKKLEVVVSKVQRVKDRVRHLRAMLGFDVETGTPLQHGATHENLNTGTARNGTGGSLPDMTSWPQ